MGERINLICTNCHYTFYDLDQGVGMLYYPENMFEGLNNRTPLILNLLKNEPTILKQYNKQLLQGATPLYTYGHHLYMCEKCNNLYSRFYFCLKTSKKYYKSKYYEAEYCCKHCNQPLTLVIYDKGRLFYTVTHKNKCKVTLNKSEKECQWSCPQCGYNKLTYELGMDWD